MPVIQLICKECGGDRFLSFSKSSRDETVASIRCEKCSTEVNVSDVVWYQENYISPALRALEDNASFTDALYLIPGS